MRDYGTGSWEGGNPDCDHRQFSYPRDRETPGGRGGSMPMSESPYRDTCGKCGATRTDKQLGLEATPDCGRRGFYRLRSDLTAEQREYVARRLAGVEIPGA